VPGFEGPKPGEHPRLFFRRADLPRLKQRAATPEGQYILKRLRRLLDGGGGDTLPDMNPSKGSGGLFKKEVTEDDGCKSFPGRGAMTLWHPAGFGFLWQITGDKKYAELGKQCTQAILDGTRCVDARYAWINANGALRAGPSLGAMAMAYDLCYDGWDESFRLKVAKALEQGPGGSHPFPLEGLVRGARLHPGSNHWGCQIGGGALACLALQNDPGIDNARIQGLLAESRKALLRQVTEGFGDGGEFWEGKGTGGIGSDTALIPAVQAWRIAGGLDFAAPRPNYSAILMNKVHDLVSIKGTPHYVVGHGGGYCNPLFTSAGMQIGVDFSKASGAALLLAIVGPQPQGSTSVSAGGKTIHIYRHGVAGRGIFVTSTSSPARAARLAALLAVLVTSIAGESSPTPPKRTYAFDGTMPREVLESYLARSINMLGMEGSKGLDDDMHQMQLRPVNVKDNPEECILKLGYGDTLYRRSRGGVTPSGWSCTALPYYIQFDNGYSIGKAGQDTGFPHAWGSCEIDWFARQTPEYRARWLEYAHRWIRENDPAGYLQMPGRAPLADPPRAGTYFLANDPSPRCPKGGYGLEAAIRRCWSD
jgi:hypothetical protein